MKQIDRCASIREILMHSFLFVNVGHFHYFFRIIIIYLNYFIKMTKGESKERLELNMDLKDFSFYFSSFFLFRFLHFSAIESIHSKSKSYFVGFLSLFLLYFLCVLFCIPFFHFVSNHFHLFCLRPKKNSFLSN